MKKVHIFPIIDCNPGSLASQTDVIIPALIKRQGTQRKTIISVTDGSPYLQGQQALESERGLPDDKRKCSKNLVCIAGAFHIRMNMLKCSIGLYHNFSIGPMGRVSKYLKNQNKEAAVDFKLFRKARQLYNIQYFYSWIIVLVLQFESDVNVVEFRTYDHFIIWANERSAIDKPFKLFYEQVFGCFLAQHAYQLGIRHNKFELRNAAFKEFLPYWFIQNHPHYAKIGILSLIDRALVNKELEEFLNNNEVFERHQGSGKSQGPDGFLEEVQGDFKKHLPPHATDKNWEDVVAFAAVNKTLQPARGHQTEKVALERDYTTYSPVLHTEG